MDVLRSVARRLSPIWIGLGALALACTIVWVPLPVVSTSSLSARLDVGSAFASAWRTASAAGASFAGALGAFRPIEVPTSPSSWPRSVDPPVATSAPERSAVAAPAAPAEAIAPTAQVVFASGGLGLNRVEWANAHGQPNGHVGEILEYDGGAVRVVFRNDRIIYVERVWGEDHPMQIEAARNESRKFLPKDAQFFRTYVATSAPNKPLVELYRSRSLSALLPIRSIRGEEPADFEVLFRHVDLRVSSLTIAVGSATNDSREKEHRY